MRAAPALALVGLLVGSLAARSATAETRGGEGYVIEVVAPPASKAGTTSTATLTVRPRGGWKLNTDYPFKLELAPGAGLRVAKPTLGKQDARTFDEGGADLDIVVTADKAGKTDLAATVKFATCDGASCEVHKERFTITATAR